LIGSEGFNIGRGIGFD